MTKRQPWGTYSFIDLTNEPPCHCGNTLSSKWYAPVADVLCTPCFKEAFTQSYYDYYKKKRGHKIALNDVMELL